MCSIFLSNKPDVNIDLVNQYIKLRGPDHTSIVKQGDLTYIHNLLSISGAFKPQPFNKEAITALFNGEIYNYLNFGSYESDGECLIDAFKEFGALFPQQLDGEFAIILVDLNSRSVYLSTDIFSTKPLHVAFSGQFFGVSSYKSALEAAGFDNIQKLPANSIFRVDLDQPKLETIGNVYSFSLNQYRKDYTAWIEAFENSVKKRSKGCREKLFIGLSSGYDSGAISCALNDLGVEYNSYSVIGKENMDVLKLRAQLISPGSTHNFIVPCGNTREVARDYIDTHVESLYYQTYSSFGDYNEFNLQLHDDSGATGLAMVCQKAIKDGCKIYLSGQGADEIMSDYGFGGKRLYPHSNFGGLFPSNLEDIFPWPSFYTSSQESYLTKEEHVAGSFGIEARYPFLDKRVVQEFLCLDVGLKNSYYKSALRFYLETKSFPSVFDMKIGF